ncbi:hypothetical protein [Embleya sp. NPDC001921]
MYLVHVTILETANHSSGSINITRLKCLIMQNSCKIEVEHVVVHNQGNSVIIGLFMISPTLADAESDALTVSRAALSAIPEFAAFEVMQCEVPLLLGPHDNPFRRP